MKLTSPIRRASPLLCAGGGVLSLLGGYWLCACCPLPEALYVSLLAADFSPVFLAGSFWLLALWCLLVVGCIGLLLLALDEVVGVFARRDGRHEGPSVTRREASPAPEANHGRTASDAVASPALGHAPAPNHSSLWVCSQTR